MGKNELRVAIWHRRGTLNDVLGTSDRSTFSGAAESVLTALLVESASSAGPIGSQNAP